MKELLQFSHAVTCKDCPGKNVLCIFHLQMYSFQNMNNMLNFILQMV